VKTAGLSFDQAPPLWVPAIFFSMVPVACVAAGGLLLVQGGGPLTAPATPGSMALTHLGTLGFLGAAMLGAMYQLVPVAAGVPVPAPRLAGAVAAAFGGGATALVVGLGTTQPAILGLGVVLLSVAFAAFLAPVGLAVARAPGTGPTVLGMRVAVAALAVLALLGLTLAAARAGWGPPPPDWSAVRRAHFGVALLCWVGGLLGAVSWTVVPMFYVAAETPAKVRRAVVAGQAITLVALPVAALASGSGAVLLVAALPGVAATWILHPVATLRSLRGRRRKRADPSLRAWQAAMTVALTLPLLGGAWLLWPQPRLGVALGWTALWGWAGLVIHGMLGRVVPFLVWFHRFSGRLGEPGVPSMKAMLPDRRLKVGLIAHAVTLAVGLIAIGTQSDLAARAAGLGLVLTGVWLGASLASVLRRR